MKNSNLISFLLFGFGIVLGLVGIILPIFVYKSTKTYYIPKIIDTRSFKFTTVTDWNIRFDDKSSDLYRDYENQIVINVNDALDGNVGGRDKRETATEMSPNKYYEIKEVQLLSLQKSNNNKVMVFISVIYVSDKENQIPEAENEVKKLNNLKNVTNIEKFDLPFSSFFCANKSQTTVIPATTIISTTTLISTTSVILPEISTVSSLIPSSSTSTSSTTISTMSSTTITPFHPLKPIANCSFDSKYVFQDLIIIYELNNDGSNKLEESRGIQEFISDTLLNPNYFTFNKTKDGIQAMKLLILPYPNPMNFYSETPSFNSINSINDLKTLFKKQLLSANSNFNQSLPETAVCFYLSNLNNQRRGLPTTLFLFSKNVPTNLDVLLQCLTELQKTEIKIILIGVGTWDQTEFESFCKESVYFGIDVKHDNNNEEIIASQITQYLRATCSVNID